MSDKNSDKRNTIPFSTWLPRERNLEAYPWVARSQFELDLSSREGRDDQTAILIRWKLFPSTDSHKEN